MFAALSSEGADRNRVFCDLVPVDRELSVLEASRLMSRRRVQALVVIDRGEGTVVPLGVVTAHDIVSRVLAAGLDAGVVTVGDIAWPDDVSTLSG